MKFRQYVKRQINCPVLLSFASSAKFELFNLALFLPFQILSEEITPTMQKLQEVGWLWNAAKYIFDGHCGRTLTSLKLS